MRSIERVRRCRACGLLKAESEFRLKSAATGVRDTICRNCYRAYQRAWYLSHRAEVIARSGVRNQRIRAENRRRAWAYLRDHPCVDCGERDPVVLEFDHISDKVSDVSKLISNGIPWAAIEAEIAKCEVRCVNCHMRKTAMETGVFRRKSSYRIAEDAFEYAA